MSRTSAVPIDPTVLLTAIPALLGFIPERSLILIAFGPERVIRATMRHDLSLDENGSSATELDVVLEGVGAISADYGVIETVAVIVDDRFARHDAHYRRVLALADHHLRVTGGVAVGFVLNTFVRDSPWQVRWRPRPAASTDAVEVSAIDQCGTIDDPHTCPTAVAEAVTTGRRVLASRSEMREMLTPQPHCAGESGAEFGPECPATSAPSSPVRSRGADSAELFAVVMDALRGYPDPDCDRLVELERALLTLDVRDAALALAVTDLRHDAESLWRVLTRRLRGRGRASAATMLAHLHYIGGEGAYAGVALDVALAADPTWSFALLLDSALRAGARPFMLWETVDYSYSICEAFGVWLPEPTLREVG